MRREAIATIITTSRPELAGVYYTHDNLVGEHGEHVLGGDVESLGRSLVLQLRHDDVALLLCPDHVSGHLLLQATQVSLAHGDGLVLGRGEELQGAGEEDWRSREQGEVQEGQRQFGTKRDVLLDEESTSLQRQAIQLERPSLSSSFHCQCNNVSTIAMYKTQNGDE